MFFCISEEILPDNVTNELEALKQYNDNIFFVNYTCGVSFLGFPYH